MKKINVELYGGKPIFGGREKPLEADEIYCDRYEQCSYYAGGKCLRCRSILAPTCKFGKTITAIGYTSRAKKYYSFKSIFRDDEVYSKLKYPNELAAIMGDTLYMRYKFGDVHKRRESDEKWKKDVDGYIIDTNCFGSGGVFIPLNEVSNKLLFAIFTNKPRALMGGVISDYQEKVVPDIIQTLKRIAPDIHKRFVTEYPQFDKEPNYIGKEIFVDSLKPNTKFKVNGKEWTFDGEYVSAANIDIGHSSPWWLQSGVHSDVKIKVNDEMTIEVNDNSIVDENTRFA